MVLWFGVTGQAPQFVTISDKAFPDRTLVLAIGCDGPGAADLLHPLQQDGPSSGHPKQQVPTRSRNDQTLAEQPGNVCALAKRDRAGGVGPSRWSSATTASPYVRHAMPRFIRLPCQDADDRGLRTPSASVRAEPSDTAWSCVVLPCWGSEPRTNHGQITNKRSRGRSPNRVTGL